VAATARPPRERPPRERPKAIRHPWRVAIVAIALIAVLNLVVILLANTDTSVPGTKDLPVTIESVSPAPGEITGLIDDVTVDLRDDLTGVLVIDGIEIPEDQLERTPELGIVTFRPGPGKELTQFRGGTNTVVVYYWPSTKDRPAHPSVHSWSFRAAA
jgi:hypothetical protein